MPAQKGNSLVYGKIALHSDMESMDKLYSVFEKVLRKGYPTDNGPLLNNGDEDLEEGEDLDAEGKVIDNGEGDEEESSQEGEERQEEAEEEVSSNRPLPAWMKEVKRG